jgi:hypothetical protein
MKGAPKIDIQTVPVKFPPARGPNSGRANWIALADRLIDANDSMARVVEAQAESIRELEAEVKLLRDRIAARKPKGGRDRTPDETVAKIERALEAKQSTRRIGETYKVSAMTVSRIRKQMKARKAL